MLSWILMVKKLFTAPSTLVDYRRLFRAWRERAQVRRTRKRGVPILEGLEERCLPSASPENPVGVVAVASPPATVSTAAVVSYVESTLGQWSRWYATFQQNLRNIGNTIGQDIAQDESLVRQLLDDRLGINPNAANSSQMTASQSGSDSGSGRGNSSGSGSGGGAMTTTQTSANQSQTISTQRVGRGSGSGSSSTNNTIVSKQGLSPVHPLTGSGSGSNGSGTGFVGSGTGSGAATVSGKVWLDNDGDGGWDNNEEGYVGATVEVIDPNTGAVVKSGTSASDGSYSITISASPDPKLYAVQVVLPLYFQGTKFGLSQINAKGTSAAFKLADGGQRNVVAGLNSMNVNTVADDPNGPGLNLQNQVTLRDAVKSGNNGRGPTVTFNTKDMNGNPTQLTGTISLQIALPDIQKSYNIAGSGSSVLAVQGNGGPFRIFTIDAGVTTTISGLRIQKGMDNSGSGGGILSQGKLTLTGDVIANNRTSGSGGGLYVKAGTATVSGGSFVSNSTATGNGGGIYVYAGTLKLRENVRVTSNVVPLNTGNGGGMYINEGKVTVSGGKFDNNSAGVSGGAIYNAGGVLTLSGVGNVNVTIGGTNSAVSQGGGLYLKIGSMTTFNGCTVSQNTAGGGIAARGNGVYQQFINNNLNAAVIFGPGGLFDPDDPKGQPVQGP